MSWTTATSYAPAFRDAATEAIDKIQQDLKGKNPSVAIVFVSAHHTPSYYSVPELIWSKLRPQALIGASASSVLGNGLELEGTPGLVVAAGTLPGVALNAFEFMEGEMPDLDGSPEEWRRKVGAPSKGTSSMLLFADPISINTQSVLDGLDFAYHNAFKSGALASGGSAPEDNALFINDEVRRQGMVGLAMGEGVRPRGLIAQSCRRVGAPMVITQAHKNVINRLGASTPLDILADIYEKANERDRELMSDNLTIGVATNPVLNGDLPVEFLMRNVTAVSELEGSISVGEAVKEGQIVQFHLIDGEFAKGDLRAALEGQPAPAKGGAPELALMFTCLGRGKRMFGQEGYESAALRRKYKDIPVAGFFCNGQINTFDHSSYLLGYSSVTSLLEPTRKRRSFKPALKPRSKSRSPHRK